MHNYMVSKHFGHFLQCWSVKAESKEDAWNNAERKGRLQYQSVYRELKDTESKGYVVDLDKKEENPISKKQYYQWLKEAIEKGMIVKPEEYKKVLFDKRKENVVEKRKSNNI